MPRYKLTIEYDGGPFVGWQRQRNGRSIQGAIEKALRRLDPDAPNIQGAGRTDAGVHATGQVAHCDSARDWDPFELGEALNHHLKPDPIAILEAARAADDFHARFDAVERRYLYRLTCRRAPLTLERGRVWRLSGELDAGAMQAGADLLTDRHDFTTFRSVQCQAQSPVKTLDRFTVTRRGPDVTCLLAARSFLHNQVRSLVGTLAQVGLGRRPVEWIADALAARDRSQCGPVAPPDGLYLTAVRYPGDDAA